MPTTSLPLLQSMAFVATTAAGVAAVAWPVPVTPTAPPALVLSRDATSRVVEADARNASTLTPTEVSARLEGLFREQNLAEASGADAADAAGLRSANLRAIAGDLEREGGEALLLALRAKAVLTFEEVVTRAPLEPHPELVGAFPRVTERYGVTREGVLVAPAFVLRTLYKARWNHLVGKLPTWNLEDVEKQAYFGWLVTNADTAPLPDRMRALRDYAEAGGTRAREMEGALWLASGQNERAKEAFLRALDERFDFRLRNYALASEPSAAAE